MTHTLTSGSHVLSVETLARVEGLDFLSPEEKLVLNHIRGHEYLCMFGLVEEFILPFVVDHARPRLNGDDYRVRALLQFATEEGKHIHLFKTSLQINISSNSILLFYKLQLKMKDQLIPPLNPNH